LIEQIDADDSRFVVASNYSQSVLGEVRGVWII